jgi:Ca2+-binding EF-hand superfamily protein
MKKNILFTLALTIGALTVSAQNQSKDAKLEALLDRSFDKAQARVFKGRDKNRDGKMTFADFESLYGEGGVKSKVQVFQKHCGADDVLDVKEFTSVRRDIHLGGGDNGERKPSLQSRLRTSREGKMFRTYDKSGDGKVTKAEWDRKFEGGPNAARTAQFKGGDKNSDGSLDVIEFLETFLAPPRGEGGGKKGGDGTNPRNDTRPEKR